MMHRPDRRAPRGYALLVTVAVLVLASALMVLAARQMVSRVDQAALEQSSRQREWGSISARQAILPFAEQLLVGREQATSQATPIAHFMVILGGQRFNIDVSDEQAKGNVNSLIERRGLSGAIDRLVEALTGTGNLKRLRLRPAELPDASESPPGQKLGPPPWITGPGQIFESADPHFFFHGPLTTLTCWGDGAVNVMRAGAPALRLATSPNLSRLQVARLLEARDAAMRTSIEHQNQTANANGDAIDQLMNEAQIDPKVRGQIEITTHSTCHAVWMDVDDGRRHSYSLAVIDNSNTAQPKRFYFQW